MKVFLIITTILLSVWLCAASKHSSYNSKRLKRYISELTRFHNEYDRSDVRGHHTRNNIGAALQNCIPGTRWKQDCNSCWCSSAGEEACTFMTCLHVDNNNNVLSNSHHRQPNSGRTVSRNSIQEHGEKHTRIRRSEDDAKQCIPGTTWRQDCNSCLCLNNGFAACTLMGCLHLDESIRTSNRQKRSSSSTTTRSPNSTSENENNCKHGTSWMKSCNRCRCFGGRAACTRMRCIERETGF